jgi:putative membrane protein
MDTAIKAKPAGDLRDYLAEERTFLAWIRTGIALMGFGFVLARFGIFLEQLHLPQQVSAAQPHEFSPWFGAALITAGALVNLFSARRFIAWLAKWTGTSSPIARSLGKVYSWPRPWRWSALP